MNLRDRLEQIESLKKKVQQISNNRNQKNTFSKKSNNKSSVSEIVPGNTIETPHGNCFYAERIITPDTSFGENSLSDIQRYFTPGLHLWLPQFNRRGEEFKLEEMLFFDTETTGLAGGSGTYIFLLGLGFFRDEEFHIRQYFMSDYHEEEALLWGVNQLFGQGFKILVTYNGKSYDFPLLQTRYIMTRQPFHLNTSHHLDLLFPTRRLWKRRLQDCTLQNIEKEVLKIRRNGDIPGYLIPQVYFRYLLDKDARPLKPVFAHNQQDIISLVLLATRIGQVLEDPLEMVKSALDLCSIGKIFEGHRDFQYSSKCYEEALKCDLSDEEAVETLRLCAFAYKKQLKWDKAEAAWRDIISLSRDFSPYPYEELAKYYEHQKKDYGQAESIVEEALQRLNRENISGSVKTEWRKDLDHRLARIKRKKQREGFSCSEG
jgi:uncharacterized protein YprB with RNaseH-like and TPR domain